MRITVKLKLGLAFVTIVLLSILTAALGINALSSLNSTMDRLLQGPVERAQLSDVLSADMLRMVRAEKSLLLSEGKDQIGQFAAEIAKWRQGLQGRLEKAEATATVEGKPEWTAARVAWSEYMPVQDKILDLANHGQHAQAL
jgi:methyl-accepting chemotaxis protein